MSTTTEASALKPGDYAPPKLGDIRGPCPGLVRMISESVPTVEVAEKGSHRRARVSTTEEFTEGADVDDR